MFIYNKANDFHGESAVEQRRLDTLSPGSLDQTPSYTVYGTSGAL